MPSPDPEKEKKAFRLRNNVGVQIDLPNGITASFVFGPGTYSDNHNMPFDVFSEKEDSVSFTGIQSNTVEIAFWNTETGKWKTKEIIAATNLEPSGDDVYGYVTVEQFLILLNEASHYGGKDLFIRDENG